MFSAGYSNKAMVINTFNVRRISFQNIEKLRHLLIQILQNPCNKIVLDLKGISFIDSVSFATINQLCQVANRKNVELVFANVETDVKELFELVPEAANYKIEALPNTIYADTNAVLV